MLTKAITYEDYNGNKKTKNFYFHLTKTELSKMIYGGLVDNLKKMIESHNNVEIYNNFEELVLSSYGEKSADGEEFIKNDEIREKFKCHPAYDVLMMEFIEGGDKAMSDFINTVVPKDIAESMSKTNREDVNKLVGFEVIPGQTQG